MAEASPIRDDYAGQLPPYDTFISTLAPKNGSPAHFETVNVLELETLASLPGKSGARVVTKTAIPSSSSSSSSSIISSSSLLPPSNYVFKGLGLAQYQNDGKDFKEHAETTLLHEIRTLHALPPHPNIMPCPKLLAVVTAPDGSDRVCGFLQPVMANESVDAQVVRATALGLRLPLARKAKWCYQMALAIQHTHQVADSYHMDLKPGNMLVDDDDNVRLIDWEQSGVSMFTHPPEVTIDQEAEERRSDAGHEGSRCFTKDNDGTLPPPPSQPSERHRTNRKTKKGKKTIIYTPREGVPRRNQKWGFPDWNVFPEWKRTCPRAAELAEIFSLGRTMWMLLEQVEMCADATVWMSASADAPRAWKDMVMRCIERDPNLRPELDEVVEFWREQQQQQQQQQL